MRRVFDIARFEWSYQARRPWIWLNTIVIMFLTFLFVRDGSFEAAQYTEFFVNSPFMIAMATVFGSLLWLVTAAFIAGESAARDVTSGMHPLVYTSSLTRLQYLGGRYFSALLLNALVLATVPFAILAAVYLPGMHPDSIGPFRQGAFISAYGFIAVPNVFAATSIQFAFASHSGRPMTAYIASLVLFFIAFFVASIVFFNKGIGILLDPIGVRFCWDELSHLWTTWEKSHRSLSLTGTLLYNRLLWMGTGVFFLLVAYRQFDFTHRTLGVPWWIRLYYRVTSFSILPSGHSSIPANDWHRPPVTTYGLSFHVRQFRWITWDTFRSIVTTWVGMGLLVVVPVFSIAVVVDQMYSLGIPMIPTTERVLRELTGALAGDLGRWMIIPAFIIYFSGEALWRERDARMDEVADATPLSDGAWLLGKVAGLTLVFVLFAVAQTVSGIVAQVAMGYTHFEVGLYLRTLFGLQVPEYFLFVILCLSIHTIVNHKYLGHLVCSVAYLYILGIFGVEHNLLVFSASPSWSYNDICGFGSTLAPWLWFKIYWLTVAVLLLVLARLMVARGKNISWKVRTQLAGRRFQGSVRTTALLAGVSMLSVGGYIFYNTNWLNDFRSSESINEWRASYERSYGRYENLPQPSLTRARVEVDLFSSLREARIKGSYVLRNTTPHPIDSIHVTMPASRSLRSTISFDRPAQPAVADHDLHYHIYRLATSLAPGDSLLLAFQLEFRQHGFSNHGYDLSLDANGSYFTNDRWFPSIGYQRSRSIINTVERREFGLPPRPILEALGQAHDGDRQPAGNRAVLETIISTDADQSGVAPGQLLRSWSEGARRFNHYQTSSAIGGEWAFFAADFDRLTQTWIPDDREQSPVEISLVHYRKHTRHLERMMKAARAALDYYTKEFGPYPYRHLTIVENPIGPGTGMHAEASFISYGQGYADWLPENENVLDLPYAIMGHEMGHQWTLPYAYTEGLPFLSEGLAWHYGIMLVQHSRDGNQLRRLLSFMRQPYPYKPMRRGEPLMRALDPYLAYKRGPLAMYALSELAGRERVNGALRSLNTKSRVTGASHVTTLDLYRELKGNVPDSLHTFLHDLFEVNTLWQFETESVNAVRSGSQWKVTLDVTARKIVYDSTGVETPQPLDEWVPIGVFAAHHDGKDELSNPLYLRKHRIRSGRQKIVVYTGGEPVIGGIDPHHLLDWEEKEDDDNLVPVSMPD